MTRVVELVEEEGEGGQILHLGFPEIVEEEGLMALHSFHHYCRLACLSSLWDCRSDCTKAPRHLHFQFHCQGDRMQAQHF